MTHEKQNYDIDYYNTYEKIENMLHVPHPRETLRPGPAKPSARRSILIVLGNTEVTDEKTYDTRYQKYRPQPLFHERRSSK